MSSRKHSKCRRTRTQGMFTGVPHVVLRHSNFIECPARAKALLFDLMEQVRFDGEGGWANNGDFQITLRCMRGRGWTSRDQLWKARNELLEASLIVQTRQGGRNHCSLYAITWEPINRCLDKHGHEKLDVPPTYAPAVNWYTLPSNRDQKTESVVRLAGHM